MIMPRSIQLSATSCCCINSYTSNKFELGQFRTQINIVYIYLKVTVMYLR